MADANTPAYAFVKPEVGASADTWGSKLNTDLDDIDALLKAIATTGSSNAYVLTTGLSLSAYVTGQSFRIIPNFGNTGAATIDVDGIGAKNLTKNVGGTPTALASGDLPSGIPTTIIYDGTQFIVTPTRDPQPLDATLTALAALSWSSGNMYIAMTAADTFALSASPQIDAIELGHASDTTVTRSASGILAVEGTDVVLCAGAQTVAGAKTFTSNPYISNEAPSLYLRDTNAGSDAKLWSVDNNGGQYQLTLLTDAGAPSAAAMAVTRSGTTPTQVICYAPLTAPVTVVTGVSGTLTTAHANRKNQLTGNITLPASVFGSGSDFMCEAGGTARTITRGSGLTMYVNGVDSASATLAANGVVAVIWRSATVCILKGDVS